jgi:hypothetical protein
MTIRELERRARMVEKAIDRALRAARVAPEPMRSNLTDFANRAQARVSALLLEVEARRAQRTGDLERARSLRADAALFERHQRPDALVLRGVEAA